MKRISILLVGCLLCAASALHAQDAAVEERLKQLTGQLQDLKETHEVLRTQNASLAKEVTSLREQLNNANTTVASQEEVIKRLAKKIEEVDQKRAADYERIVSQIEALGKTIAAAAAPPPKPSGKLSEKAPLPSNLSDKGYEYVIQKNDKLELIVAAYRKQQNLKVTVEDVLQANPGLNPNKLYVGKVIFIPVPKP